MSLRSYLHRSRSVFVRLTAGGLILLTVACQARAQSASPIESAYLRIQSALADDKLDGVQAGSEVIASEARTLKNPDLGSAAKTLAAATDIKSARDAFGALSDAVLAQLGEARSKNVRVAYCPMVRKSWLQTAETIQNPYFGRQMISCGEFRK